jgi:predicted AlkP superfamily phosphohydrolase/phosphomutase
MELFLENYDWDLFVGMFYETEQAHHQFASFIDPEHPLYNPDQAETVKRVYSVVDDAIERLQRQFDEETTVILMSDHGFCPVYERISVNRLLEEHGHYAPPTDRGPVGSESVYVDVFETLKSSELLRSLVREAGRLPVVREVVANAVSSYREKAGQKAVSADWSETTAFNGYEHGGIFINHDTLPEGIVGEEDIDCLIDQVVEDLRNNGYLSSRIANVCRREDIFSGPNLDRLPEVIVEFENGYLGSSGYHEQRSRDALQLREEGKPIGFHTMKGFIATAGPEVAPGTVTGASLLDIAPTVHHYFNLPIPATYDGSVLETIFRTDSEFRHRDPSYFENSREREKESLLDTEREGIEDRLEEMGYL